MAGLQTAHPAETGMEHRGVRDELSATGDGADNRESVGDFANLSRKRLVSATMGSETGKLRRTRSSRSSSSSETTEDARDARRRWQQQQQPQLSSSGSDTWRLAAWPRHCETIFSNEVEKHVRSSQSGVPRRPSLFCGWNQCTVRSYPLSSCIVV